MYIGRLGGLSGNTHKFGSALPTAEKVECFFVSQSNIAPGKLVMNGDLIVAQALGVYIQEATEAGDHRFCGVYEGVTGNLDATIVQTGGYPAQPKRRRAQPGDIVLVTVYGIALAEVEAGIPAGDTLSASDNGIAILNFSGIPEGLQGAIINLDSGNTPTATAVFVKCL